MNGHKYELSDMKWVKLVDGKHTVEPASHRTNRKELCEHCGISSVCKARSKLIEMEQLHKLKLGIRSCGQFRITLTFRSNVGMDEVFNTIRLGSAWARRVEPGQIVNLRTTKGDKIGIGEVISKYVAEFDDALSDHAHMNHVGIGKENPVDVVKKELITAHGKNFVARADVLSIIYVKPLKDEEVEDHIRTD